MYILNAQKPVTLPNGNQMKKHTIFISLLILTLSNSASKTHAQSRQALKYSNEFLSLGVGARNVAMGNAVVASIDDATSTFYNPAGLASNYNDRQLVVMYNNHFSGLASHQFGSLAVKINTQNAYAVSFVRFGVDNIPNTINIIDRVGRVDYSKLGRFSVADYAGMVSYGRQTRDQSFKFGVNTKVIRRIVGKFAQSWGFGFDVGLQRHIKKWHFGLMVKDITTTFNVWNYDLEKFREGLLIANNDIPLQAFEYTKPKFILGIGKEIQIKDRTSLLLETNFAINTDGARNTAFRFNNTSIDPTVGIEFDFAKKLFVRGGISNIQQTFLMDSTRSNWVFQPSAGVGFNLKNLTFDYAINIGTASDAYYSNIISMKLDFNRSKSRKKQGKLVR